MEEAAKRAIVQATVDDAFRRALPTVCLATGIFLVACAPLVLLFPPIGSAEAFGATTAAVGILLWLLGRTMRKDAWSVGQLHAAAFVIILGLTGFTLVYYVLTPNDPTLVASMLILAVGVGLLLVDHRWFAVALAVILAVWWGWAMRTVPQDVLLFYAGNLMTAAFAAVLVHVLRVGALRRAGAALADVAEREEQLKVALASEAKARTAADQALGIKSQFLASVSHEIRTPMNAVIGMTELLQGTRLDQPQREMVTVVKESGDHLLGIINDILDFSKLEAGRVELERVAVPVQGLVESAVHLVQAAIQEKDLALDVQIAPGTPEAIRADAGRIRQALLNLLSNAVKFTQRGSITVEVSATPRPDGQCELAFAVRDTGVGVPKAQFDRLWKSFSQADASTSRKYGGTGLGLVITKQLATLMGGTVSAESEEGKGSTFRFTIVAPIVHLDEPAQGHPPAAETTVGALPESGAANGLAVLLAEDNVVNQKVAMRMLERFGVRPDLAADGAQAVAAAQAKRYDLILMDVMMPGMDGLEATARIRASPAGGGPRIAAMTALALEGDREKCMAAGMDDYIPKPVRLNDMARIVEAARTPRKT